MPRASPLDPVADELFLHHFWLITNWTPTQVSAEGHMGELMSVLDPALSSSPRQKSTYAGEVVKVHVPSGDAFAANEVRLLLNALAYNVMHVLRRLLEEATGEGVSLQRLRERVLRVAARVLVHGRRAVLVITKGSARLWESLWSRLRLLHAPPLLTSSLLVSLPHRTGRASRGCRGRSGAPRCWRAS